jgi:pilus assembly protein CpaC
LTICFVLLGAIRASAIQEETIAKPQGKTVQVYANQSTLVNSPFNIKRVSIAKPEIADVEVVSTRQMVVIGKSAGTTTLIYWSEQEVPTSVDVVVGIYLEQVRENLQKIAPDAKFEVTASGDTLVLSGTVSSDMVQNRLVEASKANVKNVVNLLKVEKLEQVLLQIRVAEVDRSLAKELGFNMLFRPTIDGGIYRGALNPPGSFNPLSGTIGDLTTPDGTLSDLSNIFFATPGATPKFAALVRILHDKGALKTLAEPNLVVASGAEGKFLVGGEFPVIYSTAAAGATAVSVVYKEFGVRLGFQPKIASNGDIYLKLAQEVSQLDFANAVVLSGFRIPALKSRKAESSLQLADGQTFVLAGLINNEVSKQVSKFPLLGDIPILGALFRSTRFENNETELMVMVTPKIVRPLDKEEIPVLPTERMEPEETDPSLLP